MARIRLAMYLEYDLDDQKLDEWYGIDPKDPTAVQQAMQIDLMNFAEEHTECTKYLPKNTQYQFTGEVLGYETKII